MKSKVSSICVSERPILWYLYYPPRFEVGMLIITVTNPIESLRSGTRSQRSEGLIKVGVD